MFRPLTRNPLLNAGLQKGSNTGVFQRPDAIGAETPHTIPDVLCTYGNVNIGGWYLTRIKRTPGVKYTVTGIYADLGTNNSGGAVDAATSIYQLVREDGYPRFRRIRYFPYTCPNGTSFGLAPLQDMFDTTLVLDPEKHYAFGFWVGAAACAVTGMTHKLVDAALFGAVGAGAMGRAYDATVSRDQEVLKFSTSDPSPFYRISNATDLIPCASFYTSEVDFLMY